MDTYEMKIDVTLPDTPKALGDWANHEINNVVAAIEFMHQLQKELDETDLKVENIKFREVKDRFEPFIIFKLPRNLAVFFYKKAIFEGDVITIQIKEMIESDENTYNPRWLYESNVECPYINPWKHSQYKGMASPVPSKYKHDVDALIFAINKVIEDHSVKKIDM